jgi:cytoskeletal protein RodZ
MIGLQSREFRLKQARIEAGLTTKDAARALRIKHEYLIAIEEGEIHALPAKVYAKGYARKYANYLGIELDENLFEDAQSSSNKRWTNSANLARFNTKLFALICLILGFVCVILWAWVHEDDRATLTEILNTITN